MSKREYRPRAKRGRVVSDVYSFRLSEKPEQVSHKQWLDEYLNELKEGETRSEKLAAFVMWAIEKAAPEVNQRFAPNAEMEAIKDELRDELKAWLMTMLKNGGNIQMMNDAHESYRAGDVIDDDLIDNIIEGFQVR